MTAVSLACCTHDPEGRLLRVVKERFPVLCRMYDRVHVVVTDATDERVVVELEGNGCDVRLQADGVGQEFISDARRMALRAALDGGRGHIHFADMDRILQWVGTCPDELKEAVKEIPKHDFLIIGRTRRAWKTHPLSQIETEELANKVCSLILGMDVDISASSRGVSHETAELILRHSKAKHCDTDSEWPIIVHCKSDIEIGYVEVDGLSYEDWLKSVEEVEKAGGLEEWKMNKDRDPVSWLPRIRTANGIAETALSTYGELCSEKI